MAKEEKTAAEKYRAERKARLAKAAAKNQRKTIGKDTGKKIGKVVAAVFVLAIVAVIAWVAISYTGLIEKNTTAVTIGDVEVSQAEYSYYYNSAYNTCYQYASYGYDIGYDVNSLPNAQQYTGVMGEIKDFPEDQTPMWTDFFKYTANNNLATIKSTIAKAKEEGIALDDEDYHEIDHQIEDMENTAKTNGYSLAAYLRASSGKGISEKLFRQILEEQALYQKFIETKTDSYKKGISKADVEKEFNKNLVTYAAVSFRTFNVKAEAVKPENSEDENATAAPTEATLKKAKEQAEEVAAKSVSEEAFLAAASEIAKENGEANYKDYLTDDSLTLTKDVMEETIHSNTNDHELAEWFFEETTKVGSTKIAETEGQGYTVYFVTETAHKPAPVVTYDVRHILVKFPEEEANENEEAKEAEAEKNDKAEESKVATIDTAAFENANIYLDVTAETAKNADTYRKAQDILVEYLNGDRTGDSFGELAAKYTEDSNGDQGGIYENVGVGKMVPEFESWALAKGREEGDVGIVETTYGYHVMYFVKTQKTAWDDAVREALASPKLEKELETLLEGENAKCTVVGEKAIAKVEEATLKLAKNQIRNSANSAMG